MRIACPFCGERESGEFSYLGDAAPKRPEFAADAPSSQAEMEDAVFDYVYLRDNVAGVMREYWYHGGGCRAWLVAERNTVTHEFGSVTAAPGAGAALAARAGE
jgi:sarcosine oxidase subunit delta